MNLFILYALLSELRRLRLHERWTKRRLLAHQADSLQRLRGYVYSHSPFYRWFHRGYAGRPLHELPVLTKKAMMENFDDLVTDRAIRLKRVEQHLARLRGDDQYLGRYRVNATSGSTGERGLFLYNRTEWNTVLASFIRAYEWLGGPMSLYPRIIIASILSPTPWHMSRRIGASLETSWAPVVSLLASEPVETIVGCLNSRQPQILIAYSSIARILANEQLAGRLHISPQYVITGAEVLTGEARRRIEEAWGKGRVFDNYAVTEGGALAAECTYHGGMHLYEDLVIFEVVDENNQPVPSGIYGDKLLITVLFNHTQPLIRYELSDSVRLKKSQCPCGRPFGMITDVQGRREDILTFPALQGGEVAINPVVFDEVLDMLPAGQWQVVQERDGLYVYLTGTPVEFSDDRLIQELHWALASRGVLVPPIRAQHVPAIPRGDTGKAPLIKSNL